jgi:hypothetical protein
MINEKNVLGEELPAPGNPLSEPVEQPADNSEPGVGNQPTDATEPGTGNQFTETSEPATEKHSIDPAEPNPTIIQPINEMEVHHHGHVHETKKWKEYVFQFFMLFLAVFCGFLAEYQLEQTIERHKEKEYIGSFVNDLKLDTARMQAVIRAITNTNTGIDSLLAISNTLTDVEHIGQFCYYYISYCTRSNIVVSNEGTLQQLKNAGGLRVIKNKGAVDSIMLYDAYNKGLDGQAARYRDNVVKGLDASDYIFDWTNFDEKDPKSLLTLQAISLINPTKEQLQYFINRVIKQKGVSIIYQRYLRDQYQRASRILPFLQKEYSM